MKENPHPEEGTKCPKLCPACRPALTLKEGTHASEHHSEHSERGEPSDSELLPTLILISWPKSPLTSGSSKPPARPPNPPRKERSLHLTISACARNTPKKEYHHFLPIQRRRCPTQGFLGYTSSQSGEQSLSDRKAFPSAIKCGPIKAHDFTVSAEMQGPNSINY